MQKCKEGFEDLKPKTKVTLLDKLIPDRGAVKRRGRPPKVKNGEGKKKCQTNTDPCVRKRTKPTKVSSKKSNIQVASDSEDDFNMVSSPKCTFTHSQMIQLKSDLLISQNSNDSDIEFQCGQKV